MTSCKRLIASLLITSIVLMGLPMSAHAALVTTDASELLGSVSVERAKVNAFMARADVQSALQARGVGPKAAAERVNAMTDAELVQVAAQVDQLPAGGDVLGLMFTVFIVLLVTDILGLTKVFPFTRSVR
jgi:hypothetical protein